MENEKYLIDYERGRGDKPWVVYRLTPGLTASGKVAIHAFPSKESAERQLEIWEARLEADRQTAFSDSWNKHFF